MGAAICQGQRTDRLALCGITYSMSTEMTRRLLAIFNLLDASPPNVPVLLEKAVSENGEKNRLKRYVITLNGASHVFLKKKCR